MPSRETVGYVVVGAGSAGCVLANDAARIMIAEKAAEIILGRAP